MNDWGLVLISILGLLVSISFLVTTIVEPFVRNKNGEKTEYNKLKILFSVLFSIFFIIFAVLTFSGMLFYYE